jgi:hypothetical protein
MSESRRLWFGVRGWAGDLAFSLAAGLCLGLIGPFGTFVAPLPFRLVYWAGLFCIGAALYGPALRAAVGLDGRWRVPGVAWLALLVVAASVPMSVISAAAATRVWPELKAMTQLAWFSQAAAVSVPLVVTYGVLTRRMWPLARGSGPGVEASGPTRVARLPERLARNVLCLQMEDHYVRVHARAGSELVLISMREAIAGLADGERVHRSWWVARRAVSEVVADGRNLRLRLVNGIEAPISRTQVARLRAAGWLGEGAPALDADPVDAGSA